MRSLIHLLPSRPITPNSRYKLVNQKYIGHLLSRLDVNDSPAINKLVYSFFKNFRTLENGLRNLTVEESNALILYSCGLLCLAGRFSAKASQAIEEMITGLRLTTVSEFLDSSGWLGIHFVILLDYLVEKKDKASLRKLVGSFSNSSSHIL